MSKDKIRVNEEIRSREVRLIRSDGTQVGIISKDEALQEAVGQGLDLVEVSSTSTPVVCRIMDFGKYKYELSKRAKEAKKNQKIIVVKEIKIRPKIGEHDYQVKLNKIKNFLTDPDNKVKVTMMFRGREMNHKELGALLMERVVKDMSEFAIVESKPCWDGRNLMAVLAPDLKALRAAAKKKDTKKPEDIEPDEIETEEKEEITDAQD